jgi:hypothetical protein
MILWCTKSSFLDSLGTPIHVFDSISKKKFKLEILIMSYNGNFNHGKIPHNIIFLTSKKGPSNFTFTVAYAV